MGMENNYKRAFDGVPGPQNLITDVPGVKVGHTTIKKDKINTGVTGILPAEDNIFQQKVPAACHVINGFGKTTGLVQIAELGTIETPILLTNTLSVGAVHDACVRYMLAHNEDIGDTTGTVNPVVGECNDGELNDIRALAVEQAHVLQAIEAAATTFAEGDVGAGAGMVCYGLKGGIGSSSRVVETSAGTYTLGCLVLSNFGDLPHLTIQGEAIGDAIAQKKQAAEGEKHPDRKEQGSIMVILATDAPLTSRQLGRLCRRVEVGIGRTGSFISHGSGEIAIGFSTANRVSHYAGEQLLHIDTLHENHMDYLFRAVVSSVEEAVVSSLLHAQTTIGRKSTCFSLKDMLKKYNVASSLL